MAALIGGFALSSLGRNFDFTNSLDLYIYMCLIMSIHLCTCSCLTSALLYRSANFQEEKQIPAWAKSHKILLTFPIGKFVVGVISYICSVLLTAWKDLEPASSFRSLALAIGVGSVSMIISTTIILGIKPLLKKSSKVGPKEG